MHSNLDKLCGPTKPLRPEPPDAVEYQGLTRSGMARLADAAKPDLSLESRFDLAYNAAHALSLAALRRRGYRPSQRYIVFQVIPETLGLGPEVWRVLAMCHDLRNRSKYEGDLRIDARVVTDLLSACQKIAKTLATLKSTPP